MGRITSNQTIRYFYKKIYGKPDEKVSSRWLNVIQEEKNISMCFFDVNDFFFTFFL